MTLEEFYTTVNGDYNSAIKRFRTQDKLIKFLKRYADDPFYEKMIHAIESGNIEESFALAHAEKGIVANFYLTDLYDAIFALVEQLRPQTKQADPQLVEQIKEKYNLVVTTIREIES